MVGHCRDTLRLALQGHSAVGYCKDTRTTLTSKSNNPTVRVGNKAAIKEAFFACSEARKCDDSFRSQKYLPISRWKWDEFLV